MKARLERIKSIIRNHHSEGDCGLFFTPNKVGDTMEKLYDAQGITLFICRKWCYFEVFGLTESEEVELMKFYDNV